MSRTRVNWRRVQMALAGVRWAQRRFDAIKVRAGQGIGRRAQECGAEA